MRNQRGNRPEMKTTTRLFRVWLTPLFCALYYSPFFFFLRYCLVVSHDYSAILRCGTNANDDVDRIIFKQAAHFVFRDKAAQFIVNRITIKSPEGFNFVKLFSPMSYFLFSIVNFIRQGNFLSLNAPLVPLWNYGGCDACKKAQDANNWLGGEKCYDV